MNKFSLIKGVGILAICIMTFFNTQLSGEQFSNQETYLKSGSMKVYFTLSQY